MGVLPGIAAGAPIVMAISMLAVAGSSSMPWASRPRAWQTAKAAIAHYTADLMTAMGIGIGLTIALITWWAV